MTFNDIFKSSFLENVTSVSLLDMTLALLLAFALGLFIYFVYKKTFAGVMYSSSFGVTLIALTMITTLVIIAVTSNVVLSRYGRRALYCTIPNCDQGAAGYRIFILVDRGRYRSGSRTDPSRGIRKCGDRHRTAHICQ